MMYEALIFQADTLWPRGDDRYGRTKMEAKLKELFGEGMQETGTQVRHSGAE